jgi:hypothetical protein
MTKLSIAVNASITGVNKTPPPIPAITATSARQKLAIKDPNRMAVIYHADIPPSGVCEPYDIKAKAK